MSDQLAGQVSPRTGTAPAGQTDPPKSEPDFPAPPKRELAAGGETTRSRMLMLQDEMRSKRSSSSVPAANPDSGSAPPGGGTGDGNGGNGPGGPDGGRRSANTSSRGEAWVWLSGGALTLTLLITLTLVIVVLVNGVGFLWPHTVYEFQLGTPEGMTDTAVAPTMAARSQVLIGEVTDSGKLPPEQITALEKVLPEGTSVPAGRINIKIGNRSLAGDEDEDVSAQEQTADFVWMPEVFITEQTAADDLVVVERHNHGNAYGRLAGLKLLGTQLPEGTGDSDWDRLQAGISFANDEKERLDGLNRSEELSQADYKKKIDDLKLRTAVFEVSDAQNQMQMVLVEIPLMNIVRAYRPNSMSVLDKCGFYVMKIGELLFDWPRNSNTEGGLMPLIFGTVVLVFLMSLISVPFGVIAAIYLREYAKEGHLVRAVRIAVNNLAGVPSIVYGIFGLGFFVYGIGGTLDDLLYADSTDPVWGTGGVLWAALTLGLLTLPVVIVATEESLAAVPSGVREGSLALGATRFQTLMRVLLPMAMPGIMTGLILAMARAAGEVAPLMVVGMVKLVNKLPVDTEAPFIHLERKFMHLGFHIYDVGFQSPNVQAAKPMVYVTTMLLVAIVFAMSGTAIWLRTRMRRKLVSSAF